MGEAEQVFTVPKATPRPRWPLPASLIVHTILLVALLRGRTPVFVAPSSVLKGANGSTVTQLYWDPRASEPDAGKLADAHAKSPLIWKQKPNRAQKPLNQSAPTQSTENQQTASAALRSVPIGSKLQTTLPRSEPRTHSRCVVRLLLPYRQAKQLWEFPTPYTELP